MDRMTEKENNLYILPHNANDLFLWLKYASYKKTLVSSNPLKLFLHILEMVHNQHFVRHTVSLILIIYTYHSYQMHDFQNIFTFL